MSKEVSNLDNGEELSIVIAKGQEFNYLFSASVPDVLDLVNAKIYLSDNSRCKPLKEYSIGNGLQVVEDAKINWFFVYDDLQGLQEAVFDVYFINTENKRRTFKGKIRVNNSIKYNN